jgi:large subunit ribosomal protein L4e
MFAPTKTWRRWHRHVNVNEKRYAVSSALAATALPALVQARGHKIDQVPEVPLVVDTKVAAAVEKTSQAVALLKVLGATADVDHVKDSRNIRAGKGKLRNRRYVQRRGPLVVYASKGPVVKAFRNIPGVSLVNVNHLNLLELAPGGHLGRFIIWTKDAFQRLEALYGSFKAPSAEKAGFSLPKPMVSNPDLGRVINSDEVQSALHDKGTSRTRRPSRKANPLKNSHALFHLNPYAKVVRRAEVKAAEKRAQAKAALVEAKRKGTKPTGQKKEKKAKGLNAQFKKVMFS